LLTEGQVSVRHLTNQAFLVGFYQLQGKSPVLILSQLLLALKDGLLHLVQFSTFDVLLQSHVSECVLLEFLVDHVVHVGDALTAVAMDNKVQKSELLETFQKDHMGGLSRALQN
jgi:hypothetical protein